MKSNTVAAKKGGTSNWNVITNPVVGSTPITFNNTDDLSRWVGTGNIEFGVNGSASRIWTKVGSDGTASSVNFSNMYGYSTLGITYNYIPTPPEPILPVPEPTTIIGLLSWLPAGIMLIRKKR